MKERDDIPREIEGAALASYRGYMTAVSEESVSGGKIAHCTATGRNGEVLSKVPLCRPYGVDSSPPADTELVFLESQAGLIVCCERYRRPTLTSGQVILYDGNGAQVKLTYGTGGSRRVEIGKGGTVKDAARKGDSVDKTNLPAPDKMQVWMAEVEGAMAAAIPYVFTPANLSTTFTKVGEISEGSATVGIED